MGAKINNKKNFDKRDRQNKTVWSTSWSKIKVKILQKQQLLEVCICQYDYAYFKVEFIKKIKNKKHVDYETRQRKHTAVLLSNLNPIKLQKWVGKISDFETLFV